MSEIFNSDFYSKLNMLRFPLRISNAAGLSGSRKSNAKGNSVEFSDFREYRLGDDIRRIDWNAYGRFDKLYVKLFMEEKEGLFNIFIDNSASMNYGEKSKGVCALRIAGILSYLVLSAGDRLSVNHMQNGTLVSHNNLSQMQAFPKCLQYLEEAVFAGEGQLLDSIKSKEFRGSGLSFIITDGFTDDMEDICKFLRFKNQDIVVVHVLAEEEINPVLDGTLNLLDMENGSSLKATMNQTLMRTYKKNLQKFYEDMENLCRRNKATYIKVNSSDSLDAICFGAMAVLK